MKSLKTKIEKSIFSILLVATIFLMVLPYKAEAAKTRIWKTTLKNTTSSMATKPMVSAKLRKDRQALILNFSRLNLSESGSYELTYLSNGTEQGIFGTINPSEGNTISKTLYFGTCSHAVCTPHTNITGMKLEVIFKLKSEKRLIKRYKIKI